MNSTDLIKEISDKTGINRDRIKLALDSFQKTVSDELAAGREVQIPGFGNFVIVSYPERTVLNPRNPEEKITAPAQNVAKFRPHKDFTMEMRNKDKEINLSDLSSADSDISYIDLSKLTVNKKILGLIPEHIARHYQIVPVEEKNGTLTVAMIDPEDQEALEVVKKKTGKILNLKICTSADLNHVLDQYTGQSEEMKEIVASVGDDEVLKPTKDQEQKAAKEDLVETALAAKIVQSLVRRAVSEGASDIHIEPTEEETIVRFRVDGVLRKIITLPREILPAIVSRIKIMSDLKIDETRLPQDGRFQLSFDSADVDFRVSTFPTVNGEKIVARILNKSAGIINLEQLGLRGSAFKIVTDNIHKSHGMILVTGPTGSGKTTTLYAVLQKLLNVAVNIVTLEDPVEYRIATINQAQVNPTIDFTFAKGLRSILRQDPDVIMIGEIRDKETAEMAINSALTGHIVLSTLHTNDAAGAVPRLLDMGIEPFLINSSANAVVAQRLCRKICDDCREAFTPDEASLNEANQAIKELSAAEPKPEKVQFFHGKGCTNCGGTGYKGRVGIYEVFELNNEMKKLVAERASGSQLNDLARKDGMVSMRQDGILKAIEGITTLEEVWRVTKD